MAKYGTTDRCTGGTVFKSSENPGEEATKAFDDNESTHWYGTALPATIGYQFTKAWKISKLRFITKNNNDNPKNFTIQGSNNGSDYTTLYTGIGNGTQNWQEFTFTNKIPYLYVKMVVTSVQAAGTWCLIDEIEMYEGIYPTSGAFLLFL